MDQAQKHLRLEILRTDSLGIAMGDTTGQPIAFPPLHLADGSLKVSMVAACSALKRQTVKIADAPAAPKVSIFRARAGSTRALATVRPVS